MTSLNDYLGDTSFDTSLPKGDTIIELDATGVEERIFEDKKDGTKKKRWLLQTDDKEYFVGVKVMKGLAKVKEEGFKKARITKQGEGMDTTYTVVGVGKK